MDQITKTSSLHETADERLPAAAYLSYKNRADGWSPGRQAACLAHLADTGVGEAAVRSVGMSVGGSYSLRRSARGYAFNLGWEAALIIARRIVVDTVMAAAINGEVSEWVREDGKTSYRRQNTKLSLTLLDRVNPAMALPEVMAVATRFDWFLQLIDEGASGETLWEYFFNDALPHAEGAARARVRASLQLSEESAGFDADEDEDEDADEDQRPIEYKSMEGPPQPLTPCSRHPLLDTGSGLACATAQEIGQAPHQVPGDDFCHDYDAVPPYGRRPVSEIRVEVIETHRKSGGAAADAWGA